jgi:cytochrome c oxidase cbb3-type subunit 3
MTMRTGVVAAVVVLALGACEREERRIDAKPLPAKAVSAEKGEYDHNAYGTTEGQLLFGQMNCSGCHSNGGGGMGPPLMDDTWRYGYSPDEIFSSIADGRPNGMPAWRSRLTNEQIWQLVSYVRSLSGLTPKGARPTRDDHMMVKPAPSQTPNASPRTVGRAEQH